MTWEIVIPRKEDCSPISRNKNWNPKGPTKGGVKEAAIKNNDKIKLTLWLTESRKSANTTPKIQESKVVVAPTRRLKPKDSLI